MPIAGRQAWIEYFRLAKSVSLLPYVESKGVRLKKAGTAEWEGPCPMCGGTDRFSINTKKQVFNCRKCGAKGDVIDFVMWLSGCDKVEACEQLTGLPRPDRTRDETLEERNSRLAENAKRNAAFHKRQEEQRTAEAARAKRDEEAIANILTPGRAVPIWGTHAEAYIHARGLNPHKNFMKDIKFVADLDYWGARDNGTRQIAHLATLPAIIAIIRDFDGNAIGLSQTYLDPKEPRKWSPEGSPTNSPTKIRGEKKGGMIRLGGPAGTLALAEGWANALAWHQLGYGPEDISLAAAVDLGNLAGGALGWVPHPVLKDGDGKPVRIRNGEPDKDRPGVILPPDIKTIILIADRDSESYATAALLRTAGNRFKAMGIAVEIAWPDAGKDWNDVVIMEMGTDDARAASP
jgi:phage/plasmid primase-like uncharacterized protein